MVSLLLTVSLVLQQNDGSAVAGGGEGAEIEGETGEWWAGIAAGG